MELPESQVVCPLLLIELSLGSRTRSGEVLHINRAHAGLVSLALRPGCDADGDHRIGAGIWSMRNRSLRQVFLLLVRLFEPVFETRRPQARVRARSKALIVHLYAVVQRLRVCNHLS